MTLVSLGDLSTPGAAPRANILCVNLVKCLSLLSLYVYYFTVCVFQFQLLLACFFFQFECYSFTPFVLFYL